MYFYSFIIKNLIRRPVRTALTALGLAVAVGSMIALLAIKSNVEDAAMRSFNRRGVDLIITQAGKTSELNSDFSEDLVELARKLPGIAPEAGLSEAVVEIMPLVRENGTIWDPAIWVQGWRLDNQAYSDLELVAGRFLQERDLGELVLTHWLGTSPVWRKAVQDAHVGKVMVGQKFAEDFGKRPGDTVVLGSDSRYEVVGVYKSFVVFENRAVTMLIQEAQKLTGKHITGFSVRAATKAKRATPEADADVARLREEIEQLRDPKDPTIRLKARTPDEYVNSISQLQIVRALTWMVGVIAVVIGVIGMLNTMIMSVLERTQEIGILRAVGWPAVRVVRMVLAEALVLGMVAAAVGTVGAVVGIRFLVMSPQVSGFVEPGVSAEVIVVGFALTVLIGVLGGLYPAVRAARLLPTEAIRHD